MFELRTAFTLPVISWLEIAAKEAPDPKLSHLIAAMRQTDTVATELLTDVKVKEDVSALSIIETAHRVSRRREMVIADELCLFVAVLKYTTNNTKLYKYIDEELNNLPRHKPLSFGIDMTSPYYALDPCIGRDKEIQMTVDSLLKRKKPNVILVGPPGVGKTAIAEGLAQLIRDNKIPALHGYRIIKIDISILMEGASIMGNLQMKVRQVIMELSQPRTIAFIDEVHSVFSNDIGKKDIADMFKPVIADGTIRLIGATTDKEFRIIEKDKALKRRFNRINVKEPSMGTTIYILQKIRKLYGKFHGILIPKELVPTVVHLGRKYVTREFDPDKSIDLMDQTAARLKNTKQRSIVDALTQVKLIKMTEADIYETLSEKTGIDTSAMSIEDVSMLRELEPSIKKKVVGQDIAVTAMVDEITKFKLGLRDKGRPAVLLFAGRPGTGKTLCARRLALTLYGSEDRLIRLDMAEFAEPHAVARLGGAPPGYVGFDEGGELTEKVKKDPYSVILVDEWEKAHRVCHNKFLSIFGEGRLTDAHGETVDFSNTICLITTNLGMGHFKDSLKEMGFGVSQKTKAEENKLYQDKVVKVIKDETPPELMRRIDRLIVFRSDFTDEELDQITTIHLKEIETRNSRVPISYDESVVKHISKQYNQEHGAATIKKYIENEVMKKVAVATLEKGYGPIVLTCKEDEIIVKSNAKPKKEEA